jgi:hypothetical protein
LKLEFCGLLLMLALLVSSASLHQHPHPPPNVSTKNSMIKMFIKDSFFCTLTLSEEKISLSLSFHIVGTYLPTYLPTAFEYAIW